MKMLKSNKVVLIVASIASLLMTAFGAQAPTAGRSSTITPRLGSMNGKTGWQPGGFGKTSEWGAGKDSFGLKPQTGGVWREGAVSGESPLRSREVHSAIRPNTAFVLPAYQPHPSVAAGGAHAAVHGVLGSNLAPRKSVLKPSTEPASTLSNTHERRETFGQKPGFGLKPTKPATSFKPKNQTLRQSTLDTGSSIKKLNAMPQ